MRALVTGHAGFIGSHIVDELLSMGINVAGVDNLSSYVVSEAANTQTVDITDFDTLAQVFKDARPHYVFHNAAAKKVDCQDDPQHNFDVNATGTLNLLKLSLQYGVKRFIHASTGSVYGQPVQFPVTEDHPTRPISPYGAAKLVAESYCQFYQTLGLDTVILRYFHVYGPRQRCGDDDGGVVGIFCRRAVQGLPLVVHGDGKQVRCFTYVKDVVMANMLAMVGYGLTNTVFNVCSGKQVSILELADMFADGLHRIEFAEPRLNDVKIWEVSSLLGNFCYTPFKEGFAETLAWYKEQYSD